MPVKGRVWRVPGLLGSEAVRESAKMPITVPCGVLQRFEPHQLGKSPQRDVRVAQRSEQHFRSHLLRRGFAAGIGDSDRHWRTEPGYAARLKA